MPDVECRRGAHLPSLGRGPAGGYTTEVCDAWPVRRQTYGYLPSRRISPPLDRYRNILLGDRGTCVWTTCSKLLPLLCCFWFGTSFAWTEVVASDIVRHHIVYLNLIKFQLQTREFDSVSIEISLRHFQLTCWNNYLLTADGNEWKQVCVGPRQITSLTLSAVLSSGAGGRYRSTGLQQTSLTSLLLLLDGADRQTDRHRTVT